MELKDLQKENRYVVSEHHFRWIRTSLKLTLFEKSARAPGYEEMEKAAAPAMHAVSSEEATLLFVLFGLLSVAYYRSSTSGTKKKAKAEKPK